MHPFPSSFLPSALKLLITLLYNAREGVSGETLIRPSSVGAIVQRIPRFAGNVSPSSSHVLLARWILGCSRGSLRKLEVENKSFRETFEMFQSSESSVFLRRLKN